MTVADLLTLEQLGPVVASPDGAWLAVVIARPRSAAEIYRDFPWGPADADHADIWLLPRDGGQRRNITNGHRDRSGSWSPVWSPDGKRLAFLSTKGGDDIRPYVWDVASGTIRKLTDRGFDVLATGDEGWPSAPLIWVDATTLVCPLRAPETPVPYYTMSKIRSTTIAVDAWNRATAGKAATASVLQSAPVEREEPHPRGQLLAFNVVTGASKVLIEGNFFSLLLSPNRRYLAAITENGPKLPSAARPLRAYRSLTEEWWHTQLVIVSLANSADHYTVTTRIAPDVGRLSFLGEHPATWSPDGSLLAVVGSDTGGRSGVVFVVNAATGRVRQLQDVTLEAQRTSWSASDDLLVLARKRTVGQPAGDTARSDWWLIDPNTMVDPRNLTAGLPAAPEMLLRGKDPTNVVGLAEGKLWAIDIHEAAVTRLTDRQTKLETVVWPGVSRRQSQVLSTLIVRASDQALYRVDWDRAIARMSPLRTPLANVELADFRPENGSAVLTGAAPDGTFLWTGNAETGRFERRFTLNPQLGRIADASRRLIEYRGLDGDSLRAVVLLPIGYQPGQRYPLICWVYPGTIVTDKLWDFELDKQSVTALNLNLLAAHGYAVLIPSMPLPPEGPPGDPYLDLPKGLMPAIDKVIDLGIADADRLGVMGHSFGGYATIALVTYTHRFRAAIAMAPPSDLTSLYGAVGPSQRYSSHPDDEFFSAALAESGQDRMGVPPWANAGRYLRNSPYFYLDRIETPLMLIQGDMDYVPMQQSEQLFTGLRRLGKPAQFVRYWGEGHIITSPANMSDLWRRIFSWLDTYLKARVSTGHECDLSDGVRAC